VKEYGGMPGRRIETSHESGKKTLQDVKRRGEGADKERGLTRQIEAEKDAGGGTKYLYQTVQTSWEAGTMQRTKRKKEKKEERKKMTPSAPNRVTDMKKEPLVGRFPGPTSSTRT